MMRRATVQRYHRHQHQHLQHGHGCPRVRSGCNTITSNLGSIHGNTVGIDVNAGTATITVTTFTTTEPASSSTTVAPAPLTGNNFDGATDNGTDLSIENAGVTIGANNAFAGDAMFIDDQSVTSYDLSSNGTTFDIANNFRIEDKMHHRVDTDLAISNGLITWVANNLYVTDAGTDHSIQRGIDSATAGNTVNVEAGTYNENVNVNKSLTILGQGSSVAGSVVSVTSGNGIVVAADGVTLQALRVAGTAATKGIYFDSVVNNPTLTNVVATGNQTGLEIHNSAVVSNLQLNQVSLVNGTNGLRIATTGQVHGLTVVDGHFDNNDYGWEVEAASGSSSNQNSFTNVNVSGTSTFNNDKFKGIYVEKLDNALFNSITVSGSGYDTALFSGGIDINLKYGTYNNGITIQNATIQNNGLNNAGGFGLAIKARGTGSDPSYAGNPATLTNVQVIGGSYTGNETGIRVGEPGKANTSPTGVLIDGVTVNNSVATGIDIQGGTSTITHAHMANNPTGIHVTAGKATIVDNLTTITGGTVGIDVDGGTALVQTTNVNGNTIGVQIRNNGIADLGQNGPGVNYTGLGVSTGGNNFSSYTAAATRHERRDRRPRHGRRVLECRSARLCGSREGRGGLQQLVEQPIGHRHRERHLARRR